MMVKELIMVAMGGGVGSVLRYLSGKIIFHNGLLNTLFVNIAGGFLAGLFAAMAVRLNWEPARQFFFITGICGGFTTFSAFSLENMQLLQQHRYGEAVLFILSGIIFSLLAVYAGFMTGK